jgi:hypothetical protein
VFSEITFSSRAAAEKTGFIVEPEGNSPLIARLNKGWLGLSKNSLYSLVLIPLAKILLL